MCNVAKKDDSQSAAANVNIIQDQMVTSTNHCNILMKTFLVNIQGNKLQTRTSRLLIDTGSQPSYTLSSTAQEKGFVQFREETIQHALF